MNEDALLKGKSHLSDERDLGAKEEFSGSLWAGLIQLSGKIVQINLLYIHVCT